MHNWPDSINVEIFTNRELEAITFAKHSIYLKFGDRLLLTIMSDFIYHSGKTSEKNNFPISHTRLISSIGSRVTKATLHEKRDLYLWFEDGVRLEVNGSIKQYECYSINFEGKEFYV